MRSDRVDTGYARCFAFLIRECEYDRDGDGDTRCFVFQWYPNFIQTHPLSLTRPWQKFLRHVSIVVEKSARCQPFDWTLKSRWRSTDKCQKNSSIWSCRSWQWQWYSCVRLVLIRCKINFVFTNFFLFLSISNRKYDLHSPKLKYFNCFRSKVKVISFV